MLADLTSSDPAQTASKTFAPAVTTGSKASTSDPSNGLAPRVIDTDGLIRAVILRKQAINNHVSAIAVSRRPSMAKMNEAVRVVPVPATWALR
jgi:hypothetical protein